MAGDRSAERHGIIADVAVTQQRVAVEGGDHARERHSPVGVDRGEGSDGELAPFADLTEVGTLGLESLAGRVVLDRSQPLAQLDVVGAALDRQCTLANLGQHDRWVEDLDPKQREAVEAVTRGVLAKLLHDPTVRLKDAAGTAKGERLSDALRELFDL